MYKMIVRDSVAVDVYDNDTLLHTFEYLDGAHEVFLIGSLSDGICQQMNNLPDLSWIGVALWQFLRALDGSLTLGETVVLLEKTTHCMAPVNRK